MRRRTYRNPPVHEVVLDLQFADELSEETLDLVPRSAPAGLGPASRLTTFVFQGGFSPTGPLPFQAALEAAGWELRSGDGPTWILRAFPNRLTLHSVRSDNWPQGEYEGWEQTAARFGQVHEALRPCYGPLQIRRAGLRYINRIAVEQGTDLRRLFSHMPPELEGVEGLFAFSTRRSWAQVSGMGGYAASVGIDRIAAVEREQPANSIGVLLDIDVFNLYVKDAPKWAEVREWFEAAHAIENKLFEHSITDDLRVIFDETVN
jgi:uncharacterized protein (TIGR04255 family)